MLAYSYAATNDVPRARCVANWYFGQKAPDGSIVAGPGPSELTDELSVAELVDSSQNVEAVILRLADKACGRPPSPILPKRQKQAPEQQWLKMNNGRRVYFTSDGQRLYDDHNYEIKDAATIAEARRELASIHELMESLGDVRRATNQALARVTQEEEDAARKLVEVHKKAIVLHDGRRVYFSADGKHLYDEQSREITDAAMIAEAQRWTPSSTTATTLHPTIPRPPVTVADLRKTSSDDQDSYAQGAVTMLYFSYAARGDISGSDCLANYYFKQSNDAQGKAIPAKGPEDFFSEISKVERIDPGKYNVDGIILGLTEKACGAAQTQSKP
jgi:hypothetical protein